ncbi:prolipoprotein diacylglyceryl transferase [Polaribacter pacificus]|uniref:Phosphatidylglycerol--prolipoprotein diacylglyceryl transferase n=1 Tax=Polaribacter pacificus TaxID=1775173 RepID=A0A917MFA9_9FLAO|nr:prolipoprotein diacylglyceryl transferase [Polaribacter pacificus]GGH03309.1 prolipoprotein diacylglyceryl transferase [Polaribacter pacificus]
MNFLSIVWDPSLGIDLGFYVIRWYSLMFVLTFILGLRLMKKMFINDSIPVEKLDPLFMYTFVSMLIGMRLGDVFFYSWDYYQDHLLEIILPFKENANSSALFGMIKGWEFTGYTGFASHGAAVGIITALYFYSRKVIKKPFLFILDRMGIMVALAGFFIRLGNFFNSEIYGKPTDGSFGVIFKAAGETVPRHPTQLYEAISYLILFVVLWKLYWKTNAKEQQGYLFGIFFAVLWSLRFIIEFLKEPQVQERGEEWLFSPLNTGQVLSIPLILIGLYFVFKKSRLQTK